MQEYKQTQIRPWLATPVVRICPDHKKSEIEETRHHAGHTETFYSRCLGESIEISALLCTSPTPWQHADYRRRTLEQCTIPTSVLDTFSCSPVCIYKHRERETDQKSEISKLPSVCFVNGFSECFIYISLLHHVYQTVF